MTVFSQMTSDPLLSDPNKIKSTEEAMDALSSCRSYYIAYGRYVAVQLCRYKESRGEDPTVHSREVLNEMEKRGILDGYNGAHFWLGSVFNGGPFEKTGTIHKYSEPGRNIHDREVKVWRLKKGAGADAYVEPIIPEFIHQRIDGARKAL